ncbi:DUF3397 domain-containing protein [Lactococcus termiticola]|uniref:DUF3397 domain-containing protein n=1 Tax=Lactococcus termiticola TaxID=2169526 RepID=A0A2R5HD62_9LACT|nr:DUF3397 domain-containing protein [Lactococcus termiticola]GBG96014.1 hypothetical protein NtB2_00116 [Lactococcus termiticola]
MLIKILMGLYPILLFIFLVFVFKFFRLRKITNYKLKIPDIFTIFLIIGLEIFSKKLAGFGILPYYFLIISGLALVLLLLDLFYYKAFSWFRFLKLWWRITFFITLVIYVGLFIMVLI